MPATLLDVSEGLSDADLAAETRAVNKIKSFPVPAIEGEVFKLCGVDVTVPPLKVKHIIQFSETMEKLVKFGQDTSQKEAFQVALPVIHAALNRNYPTLTNDDVLELLDVKTVTEVIMAIMGKSGFRPVKPGE